MISGLGISMAASGSGTTFWEGFALGGMELGIPAFTGTLAGELAAGEKFSTAITNAGIIGGITFVTAGLIEGAYADRYQRIGYKSSRNALAEPTNATNDGNSNKALILDKGKAASGDPIIDDPIVRAEMEKAWGESFSQDGNRVYEQGAWIINDQQSGYAVQRWPRGNSGSIGIPDTRPSGALGSFHTHPYAPYEISIHGISGRDYVNARGALYGLNNYAVDKEGIMKYYPSSGNQDPSIGTYDDVVRR